MLHNMHGYKNNLRNGNKELTYVVLNIRELTTSKHSFLVIDTYVFG